jgi:hypothetical protein
MANQYSGPSEKPEDAERHFSRVPDVPRTFFPIKGLPCLQAAARGPILYIAWPSATRTGAAIRSAESASPVASSG